MFSKKESAYFGQSMVRVDVGQTGNQLHARLKKKKNQDKLVSTECKILWRPRRQTKIKEWDGNVSIYGTHARCQSLYQEL